jgi:hypothetical protein
MLIVIWQFPVTEVSETETQNIKDAASSDGA